MKKYNNNIESNVRSPYSKPFCYSTWYTNMKLVWLNIILYNDKDWLKRRKVTVKSDPLPFWFSTSFRAINMCQLMSSIHLVKKQVNCIGMITIFGFCSPWFRTFFEQSRFCFRPFKFPVFSLLQKSSSTITFSFFLFYSSFPSSYYL